MRVLGISAFYHDSAAALVSDGKIVAAVQEERFSRIKHDAKFPTRSIAYCLLQAKCSLRDLDAVVFYEKPLIKFERLLETYLAFAPVGFRSFSTAMPVWLREKLFQKSSLTKSLRGIDEGFDDEKLLFSEHHLSHAASAFYPSPFDNAAILTMDGVGEWCTTSLSTGAGNELQSLSEIHFPNSLGLLYSAFTYYLGFKVNSGEYKVMGLAPYGEPKYSDLILDNLIDVKADGTFRLDQSYFDYCTGLRMTNSKFAALFQQKERKANELLTPFHMDLAASLQDVTEKIVLKLAKSARSKTGNRNLCLAGGVALNCVANGKLHAASIFDNIWIQPAAGDAGGAVGAALTGYHNFGGQPRIVAKFDGMNCSYLGPSFSQSEIETALQNCGGVFSVKSPDEVVSITARALAEGQAVGWMQGRMEFGPRALGGRSILGDPRSPSMQKTLNLKVKYRESFRPFAPAILREKLSEWFDLDVDTPYMLMVAPVAEKHRQTMTEAERSLFGIDKLNIPRSDIPAVTHVDYSARIQTVHDETNPKFHSLLKEFERLTGCPVLVNTSFNVRGEPIVCTPEDAFRCFMGSELDMLVVGDCMLLKSEQDMRLKLDYKTHFDLD